MPFFKRKPTLAICFYGTVADINLEEIKKNCSTRFPEYDIVYFENFGDIKPLKNLWLCSFKKRQYELDNGIEFNICIAVDPSVDWVSMWLNSINPLMILDSSKLKSISDDILYFPKGSCSIRAVTSVPVCMFFASSHIFDLACNFIIALPSLPRDRYTTTIDEDFYFFLKTLKIKTECSNYENSSLFKRAT